jgi:hypothetical protein
MKKAQAQSAAERDYLVLHEDVFYDYFKPYRHPKTTCNCWGGIGLETFGGDLDLVRNHDSAYVWTVMDGGESADQWIGSGYHFVNRIAYLVTERAHHDLSLDFRVPRRMCGLTRLGMTRQMNQLKRFLIQRGVQWQQ